MILSFVDHYADKILWMSFLFLYREWVAFGIKHKWKGLLVLICLCKAVSDKTIRELVDRGATNVKQVMASCKAGSDCGSCLSEVKELIELLKNGDGDEQKSA